MPISVHATNTTDSRGSWRLLTRRNISWSLLLQLDKHLATVHRTYDFLPYIKNRRTLRQFYPPPRQLGFSRTKVSQQHHGLDKIHGFALLKLSDLSHLQELTTTLTLHCLQRHLLTKPSINFNIRCSGFAECRTRKPEALS